MKEKTFDEMIEGVEFTVRMGVDIELDIFSKYILDIDEVEYVSISSGNKNHTVYIETNYRLTQEETDTFIIPLMKVVEYKNHIYQVREDDFNIIYEMASFSDDKQGFLCNFVVFCPYCR